MKKYIRLILLCLLFFPFNNYASESQDKDEYKNTQALKTMKWIKDNGINLTAGSAAYLAARACKLSTFGKIYSTLLTYGVTDVATSKNDLVGKCLPHAQTWYNELHKKYPAANFNKIPFKVDDRWAADHKSIHCDLSDIDYINDIYQKKYNGEKISEDEQEIISESEWVALHEAGHIKNNDIITSTVVKIGIGIGLESLFHAYNKKMNIDAATRSLPKRIGFFIPMFFGTAYLASSYSQYYEKRADAFANQHADDNALIAGKKYLKQDNTLLKECEAMKATPSPKSEKMVQELFSTHPSIESRIQSIDNEIIRRAAQKK